MNYDNYEKKIVEEMGYALIGWPVSGGDVTNPGTLTTEELAKLDTALTQKTCRWVKLSPSELKARQENNQIRQANGANIYKARKQRGSKRPRTENLEDVD
jgi:hypothetical protein